MSAGPFIKIIEDRPLRIPRTDDGAGGLLALVPLRGITILSSGSDLRRRICTGRGFILPQVGKLDVIPDSRTGSKVLVAVLRGAERRFVLQDLPPLPKLFQSTPLLTDYKGLLPDNTLPFESLIEQLGCAYAGHRNAMSDLLGSHDHRLSLYRRLLDVYTRLETDFDHEAGHAQAGAYTSQSNFYRLFRRSFDTTPKQHLIRARTLLGMSLLVWSTSPVKDISNWCGHHDRTAFARAFKSNTGYSPMGFRKAVLQGQKDHENFRTFLSVVDRVLKV